MFHMKRTVLLLGVGAFMTSCAWASGFALYEPTAVGTAMGGALLGKGVDASANTINPATLTDITNITVTLGFVTEHPRARIKINGNGSKPLDPGPFLLPHFQAVVPLPWDFTFGLGLAPEYGLGTHYTHGGEMTWSSRETTIKGFVLNPNLAYKITDRWSVGAGVRLLYFDFEQESYPQAVFQHPDTGLPMNGGSVRNHLHGDNDFEDVGWQVGTSYKLLDNLSFGAVYKSKIDVHVKGHTRARPRTTYVPEACAGYVSALTGPASANIELPQSVAFGCNWDITDTWHLGLAASWTDWSSIDTLKFHLNGNTKPIKLGWKDSWRFAIAPSWDFAENWTAMISYVYDMNVCPSDQESTMLPPGDRQIISGGLAWRITENLECDMSYGLVIMGSNDSMHMRDSFGKEYRLECHRGLSHAVGFSVTYRF